MITQDYLQEIEETGGLNRLIFHESGVFAESPESTDVSLSVFIDAENDKNSYIIEFSHSIDNWETIDKTERFECLLDAINRFKRANSIIDNILIEEKQEASKRWEKESNIMKTPTHSDDVSEKLDRMERKYHFFMLVYDLLVVGILILFTYVFFNYSDNHQVYGIIIAISVFFFTCLGFRLGDIYFKDYPYRF